MPAEHEQVTTTKEERARTCEECAAIRGKRRLKRADILEQHWRGHIVGAIYQQTHALAAGKGWVLSPEEILDLPAWQPEYREFQPEPICGSVPPCPRHAMALDEWRVQHEIDLEHNASEQALSGMRWYILRQLQKAFRRAENRAAAQCGAHAKRTGQPCKAMAVHPDSRNRRCRVHGGMSTGWKNPASRAKVAEVRRRYMLEVWRQRRQAAEMPHMHT